MKAEIHPEVRDVIFQDTVCGVMFKIQSCVKTKHTVTVEGVEYPLVKIDISSASHPFYTGQQRIVDTAGRVEKFSKKMGTAKLSSLGKKPAAAAK